MTEPSVYSSVSSENMATWLRPKRLVCFGLGFGCSLQGFDDIQDLVHDKVWQLLLWFVVEVRKRDRSTVFDEFRGCTP